MVKNDSNFQPKFDSIKCEPNYKQNINNISQKAMPALTPSNPSSVFLEKSISENNLLNWIKSSKRSFKIPSQPYGKSLFVSRGIYKYKNPVDEIFPCNIVDNGVGNCELNSMQRSISMETIRDLHRKTNETNEVNKVNKVNEKITENPNATDSSQPKPKYSQVSPTMVINAEGEIMQGSVISPLICPPRSRCVFIGEFTRECVFNVLRISRKWDYPLKYIIGFHSYFITSCCRMLKSHINQFTNGGAFINGVFPELLERIKQESRGQNYCLCVDVSSNEELDLVEPLLRDASAYIICGKMPMLSRLAPYVDYLFMSRSAGISKQYEANLRKKSMCMVSTRNMLKYSMGYKLSVLAYYLDKLEDNEYIVAVNPFNSTVLNLWYLPYCKGLTTMESNAFYYPIGCVMNYFANGGNSHRKAIKTYYVKNYRAKKMQAVIAERGNSLSFLYKDYLPRDIFLIIFSFAF